MAKTAQKTGFTHEDFAKVLFELAEDMLCKLGALKHLPGDVYYCCITRKDSPQDPEEKITGNYVHFYYVEENNSFYFGKCFNGKVSDRGRRFYYKALKPREIRDLQIEIEEWII